MDKKKNTETEILKAAKKIFIEHGYAGARMQAIADEAKINKAMLHYYYRSKEMLFDKIMEGAIEMMSKQFIDALSGTTPIMTKLKVLINNYTDTIIRNPHIPIFILHEMARNRLYFQNKMQQRLEQNNVFQNFLLQIAEEQKKGILRAIPVPQFMFTVMSLIIFPHIAKPVFSKIFTLEDDIYAQMMEERKEHIYNVLRSALML
ncbi:MAG: TetR/AcrR family transcriptional regulator [Bacteroidota bacterium]